MTSKGPEPNWSAYEEEVFRAFKDHLPNAEIRRNVRLRGRFSKRQRQIDILIKEETPAGDLLTVVETKFFGRKIDVKTVDSLAGFVDDIGAQRGMLITNEGYTKAALRWAYYGPSKLELDILNLSALKRFQGFTAIPYKGRNAFMIGAPFGWVIDANPMNGCLASLYQRGLDEATAMAQKEIIYVNYWDRSADPLTAAQLDEQQLRNLKAFGPVEVTHTPTVQRDDALTRLRIADVQRYGCLEATGFVEFSEAIFFAVLLTPKETQRSNLRRLESVLRQAIPVNLKRDNSHLIAKIQKELKEDIPASRRAELIREAGHWFRDMDELDSARGMLEESLSIDSAGGAGYRTINELLPVLRGLRNRSRALEIMGQLLRLDPHKPTVFNDCFEFAAGWVERADLLAVIDDLKQERLGDEFLQANCDFFAGNVLAVDDSVSSRKRFLAARKTFRRILPSGHQVFRTISRALRLSKLHRK